MYQFFVDAYTFERTVEYLVQGFLADVGNRGFQRIVVFMEDGINLPEYHLALVFAQWHNAPLVDAFLAVGNHLVQVYLVDIAQTLASRTGSLGRVERERVWRRVAVRDACGGTHQPLGKMLDGSGLVIHDHDKTLALLHRYLDGVLQSFGRLSGQRL